MEKQERSFLSLEEAEKMIPQKEYIHTFKNARAGMIIGIDVKRSDVIKMIKKAGVAELSGHTATSMGHGIAVNDFNGFTFIETV